MIDRSKKTAENYQRVISMNKIVKNTSWIVFSVLLTACGGGGGSTSSENNVNQETTATTTPIAGESSAFQLNAFTISSNVQASSNTQFDFSVVADAEGLVSYRFESIFPQFHYKPNSGVIALKNKEGQVVAEYLAPQNSGTYHYTLQLTDSQGLTIEHPFNVEVN